MLKYDTVLFTTLDKKNDGFRLYKVFYDIKTGKKMITKKQNEESEELVSIDKGWMAPLLLLVCVSAPCYDAPICFLAVGN